MENAYDTIITNNGSHDDYIIHLFNSLLSTKNSVFKDYIQVFKNQWEDDDEAMTSTHIIAKAKPKFVNMQRSKDWGKNDPKDTQLIALITKIEKLK